MQETIFKNGRQYRSHPVQDFKIGAWKFCLTLFYIEEQVNITPYRDPETDDRKQKIEFSNNKNKGYVSSVSWPTV
jgi:hypothetical protein